MINVVELAKDHPVESVIVGGAAVLALFYVFRSPSGNASDAAQESALQNAYFQAEAIQAQSGAAVQTAQISANQNVAIAKLAADTQQNSDTLWSANSLAVTQSNNDAQTAALPYMTESALIDALAGVSQQTQTTKKASSGFLGIGASQKSVTTSTPAAIQASDYLSELAHGMYAMH